MANLAACWISAVRIATAVSMSDLDFSGICVSIRSYRVFRKAYYIEMVSAVVG